MLIYTESLQQQIFNLQQSIIVVAKEPLEIKSNSANVHLYCSEDTLDFLLAISSAQDDLKCIDSFL